MAARQRKFPVHASEVIARLLEGGDDRASSGQRKAQKLALSVFRAFGRLGPPITTHAEPTFFRGGVLSVTVDDSGWLTELSFLIPEMKERLNRTLGARTGSEVVEEIRLRHGHLGRRREAPAKAAPPALTPDQERRIEGWTSEVKDPAVREAVRRAARYAFAAPTPAPDRK